MNSKFEDKLKSDFTSETPDVLDKIKQSHRFKVPKAPEKRSISDIFRLRKVRYTFASMFVVVLLAIVFMNQQSEQIYASTVTLDLNPQLEFTLDEDDRIISIQALNDDGEEIIQDLGKYRRQDVREILGKVVKYLFDNGYLTVEDNAIMVYVEGVSPEIQERVQEFIENKLQEEAQRYQRQFEFIHRNNLDYTQEQLDRIHAFAQEHNIHPGRVILILEIRQADDSYTIQELRFMRMRDLHDLYKELYPPLDEPGNGPGGPGGN